MQSKTKKLVLNKGEGNFSISTKAFQWLMDHKQWHTTVFIMKGVGKNKSAKIIKLGDEDVSKTFFYNASQLYPLYCFNGQCKRTDPDLIECIESLGDHANTLSSKLQIVEIPHNYQYIIDRDEKGKEIIRDKKNHDFLS